MALTTLVRQVARVRRRLFLGSLLSLLAWSWVGALALAAGWFFVQPYVLAEPPDWLRWAVLGGLAGLSTAAALTLAVLRAPNQVTADLSLDERFGLRERVTTSLTLAPEQAVTPAGQALLADVEGRLAQVRVADRFPVRLPWKPAALLPACAVALLLLALYWNPNLGTGEASAATDPVTPAEARAAIDEQMKKLALNKPAARKAEEQPKSEDLQKIQADIENFTRKPRETRDDIRERIKDATALEAEIKRQQKEQAQRIDALKEAMKQAERLTRKNRKKDQEGPGKNAADALARGDMERSRDELERLSRELEKEQKKEEEKERLRRKKRDAKTEEEKEKLDRELDKLEKNSKLSDKDKEDLQKQLEDMKDQLERLSRKKEDLAKELKEMAEKGEIDKEQLERELEQLEKENQLSEEEKKELEEAAKELGECKECMKQGKNGEAGKKLAKAAKKMGGAGGKEGDEQERARMLQRVQAVKKALCRSLAGNNPAPGAGRRPDGKDKGDTAHEDKLAPGELGKGQMEVVGQGPKGGLKFDGPRKPTDMKEEIRQAGQEAAAAIDRQRLPPSARKMARDYFQKVRSQEKDAKKP